MTAPDTQLARRIEAVNRQAAGRSCDNLEFVASRAMFGHADVYFVDGGVWVARVPGDQVFLEVLEALAAAVRIGTALGRDQGKRDVGDFLRRECGL